MLRVSFRPEAATGGMSVTLSGWGEPREGRRVTGSDYSCLYFTDAV